MNNRLAKSITVLMSKEDIEDMNSRINALGITKAQYLRALVRSDVANKLITQQQATNDADTDATT